MQLSFFKINLLAVQSTHFSKLCATTLTTNNNSTAPTSSYVLSPLRLHFHTTDVRRTEPGNFLTKCCSSSPPPHPTTPPSPPPPTNKSAFHPPLAFHFLHSLLLVFISISIVAMSLSRKINRLRFSLVFGGLKLKFII